MVPQVTNSADSPVQARSRRNASRRPKSPVLRNLCKQLSRRRTAEGLGRRRRSEDSCSQQRTTPVHTIHANTCYISPSMLEFDLVMATTPSKSHLTVVPIPDASPLPPGAVSSVRRSVGSAPPGMGSHLAIQKLDTLPSKTLRSE